MAQELQNSFQLSWAPDLSLAQNQETFADRPGCLGSAGNGRRWAGDGPGLTHRLLKAAPWPSGFSLGRTVGSGGDGVVRC
jgi:hypothetical protein